jgi:hypothetical protein
LDFAFALAFPFDLPFAFPLALAFRLRAVDPDRPVPDLDEDLFRGLFEFF